MATPRRRRVALIVVLESYGTDCVMSSSLVRSVTHTSNVEPITTNKNHDCVLCVCVCASVCFIYELPLCLCLCGEFVVTCQIDRDNCQTDRHPCQIDSGACGVDRDCCQIDKDICQMFRYSETPVNNRMQVVSLCRSYVFTLPPSE